MKAQRAMALDMKWHAGTSSEVLIEISLIFREYYEAAYVEGRLRVEGPLDRATGGLKSGQCVRHFVHRHEPPVPAAPIAVLESANGLVAVNKPACVPVHVAGQYRKNTVVGILEATRPDLGTLHPVHRLDKPVSGVLLLAQNGVAADAVRQRVASHEVSKEYIARVEGANRFDWILWCEVSKGHSC
jgi:23S rRNA-/tRNA-specific pseudouridylate synthase